MKNQHIVYKLLICGMAGIIAATLPVSRSLNVYIMVGALALGYWLGREKIQ